ncbi:MAG: mannose-1-phosphate guanylyltransferase [Verrucomicrobiota bacterium]
MSSSLYVLILAGGSGERFWPLSRSSRPKQLLSLFSDTTLLEQTLERLDGLVPLENILILTNRDQEKAVRELACNLPPENIVAEPAKRDTAAAIALGAGWISLRDHHATMIVLPADHLIKDRENFQKTLRVAAEAAERTGELVTIGIKPSWACPGFGYIEQGKKFHLPGLPDTPAVYEVVRFREKPAPELAESFLKQGNFRWNAGMFIWPLTSILSAFKRHTPELATFIQHIHECHDLEHLLSKHFHKLPKISIDYAVMEKADRVLMVEAAFDWDDVGSWTAVAKYFPKDEGNNLSNTSLSTIDATDNLVFSKNKLHVALMGVRDLIVVQTEDAILVCHREEAEKIKNLVKKIPGELQ